MGDANLEDELPTYVILRDQAVQPNITFNIKKEFCVFCFTQHPININQPVENYMHLMQDVFKINIADYNLPLLGCQTCIIELEEVRRIKQKFESAHCIIKRRLIEDNERQNHLNTLPQKLTPESEHCSNPPNVLGNVHMYNSTSETNPLVQPIIPSQILIDPNSQQVLGLVIPLMVQTTGQKGCSNVREVNTKSTIKNKYKVSSNTPNIRKIKKNMVQRNLKQSQLLTSIETKGNQNNVASHIDPSTNKNNLIEDFNISYKNSVDPHNLLQNVVASKQMNIVIQNETNDQMNPLLRLHRLQLSDLKALGVVISSHDCDIIQNITGKVSPIKSTSKDSSYSESRKIRE